MINRTKLLNGVNSCGNPRTFKNTINNSSNSLATIAKSNLEVKVNKNSPPKLSMSQSLSKPLKHIRSSGQL